MGGSDRKKGEPNRGKNRGQGSIGSGSGSGEKGCGPGLGLKCVSWDDVRVTRDDATG